LEYSYHGYDFTFYTTDADTITECRVTEQFLYRYSSYDKKTQTFGVGTLFNLEKVYLFAGMQAATSGTKERSIPRMTASSPDVRRHNSCWKKSKLGGTRRGDSYSLESPRVLPVPR
jgi:hypothetical protein